MPVHKQHGPPAKGLLHGIRVLRRSHSLVLLLACIPLLYGLVWWLLKRDQRMEAGTPYFMDTCENRVADLGLDLGLHLASQRKRLYENMALDASKGIKLGGVITQGLGQDDLYHVGMDKR